MFKVVDCNAEPDCRYPVRAGAIGVGVSVASRCCSGGKAAAPFCKQAVDSLMYPVKDVLRRFRPCPRFDARQLLKIPLETCFPQPSCGNGKWRVGLTSSNRPMSVPDGFVKSVRVMGKCIYSGFLGDIYFYIKDMKLLKNFLFFALAVFYVHSSIAGDISDHVQSRSYWSEFEWRQATISEVWQDSDFIPQNWKNSDPSSEIFVKRRRLDLDGREYSVSLLRSPLLIDHPDSLSMSVVSKITAEDCSTVFAEWQQRFGVPLLKMDNSYQPYAGNLIRSTLKSWSLNNTVVISSCMVLGEQVLFTTRFQSNAIKLPESPIHLQCTRSFRMTSKPNDYENMPPAILTVIQHERVVVDGAGVLIAKLNTMSDSIIQFDTKVNDLAFSFTIDRVSGSFSGSATSSQEKRIVGNFLGLCEKRIPGQRRF